MLPDFRIRQRDYLLGIASALTQELDLETVLRRILRASAELSGAPAALIALRQLPDLNGETIGPFRIQAHYNLNPNFVRQFNGVLSQTYGLTESDPLPLIMNELKLRLAAVVRHGHYDIKGTVGLPLISRGNFEGLLLLFGAYRAPLSYGPEIERMLQTFANQAAIAVTNARLYEQVAHEKMRLDAMLDGSADGILLMDAEHNIERWNRALAKLTQVHDSEAIGKTHEDLIFWKSREPGQDLLEAETSGWPAQMNTTLYVEGDLLRRDGSTIAVGVTYAPIFRNTRLVNIIANVRDITKFKEAERLKSSFISGISHELKTPVALIKGYAGTLQREDANWDRATINDGLAVIEEEADRLHTLVDNLLEASRLQAGGIELRYQDVDLKHLAGRTKRLFEPQTDKHEISIDFPEDFPLVRADEDRIVQVYTNLLSNAIKYSPDGGKVRISGKIEGNEALVSVSDQGPGIAPHELEKIFDRFYRAKSDLTVKAKGAGLGLYLTRAIVEAHRGYIWATSQLGVGTTFTFKLPIQ